HPLMRLAIAAAAASLLLVSGAAKAASFDCKKAASRVEHLICDDGDLNSFDSQIEGAYLGALDRSNDPSHVKETQRAWLKERDGCGDAKCMAAAYQRRIAVLSELSDEPPVCSGFTTPEADACGVEHASRADRELDRYVAAVRKQLTEEAADSPERKAP